MDNKERAIHMTKSFAADIAIIRERANNDIKTYFDKNAKDPFNSRICGDIIYKLDEHRKTELRTCDNLVSDIRPLLISNYSNFEFIEKKMKKNRIDINKFYNSHIDQWLELKSTIDSFKL